MAGGTGLQAIQPRTNLSVPSMVCISLMTNGERNLGLAGEVGERTRGCREPSADLKKYNKSFS